MIVQRNGAKATVGNAVVPRDPASGVPWCPCRCCRLRCEAGEEMGALNAHKKREREIKAPRVSISLLSATNFCISDSPDLHTVLHEALPPPVPPPRRTLWLSSSVVSMLPCVGIGSPRCVSNCRRFACSLQYSSSSVNGHRKCLGPSTAPRRSIIAGGKWGSGPVARPSWHSICRCSRSAVCSVREGMDRIGKVPRADACGSCCLGC